MCVVRTWVQVHVVWCGEYVVCAHGCGACVCVSLSVYVMWCVCDACAWCVHGCKSLCSVDVSGRCGGCGVCVCMVHLHVDGCV